MRSDVQQRALPLADDLPLSAPTARDRGRPWRRNSLFGDAAHFRSISKADRMRVWEAAKAFDRRTHKRGKHGGMVGHSGLAVLRCLLFDFLNTSTGRLDPSYAAIAAKTGLARSVVIEAVKRLVAAGVLERTRRLIRERVKAWCELGGKVIWFWRTRQTSNAYRVNFPLSDRRDLGDLDRPPAEPRSSHPVDQAVAAAGAEVDPRKRADLLDHAAERADALDAVIAGTKNQALAVARNRQAIEDRKRQAEQAASELRDRLALAYADPAAAEAAWQHLARERGIAGAVAAVTRDPASLGPLKGRRILFGLIANRERADAAASARLVPEAAAKAWNTAIARDLDRAASYRLDRIDAGPDMTRRRQALAERGTGHTARDLRDQAAALRRNADLAELHTAVAQAQEIGPDPASPARLAVTWAANRAFLCTFIRASPG